MSADKGWEEFLKFKNFSDTSNYEEGSHYLDDGGTLYINSDGSGTFYGDDGETGYLNSDGSGTYYGADGETGYLNSDGSGTFYGSNSETGYLNSDGSGTYYGNSDETGYLNSDGSGTYYGADDAEYYSSDDVSGEGGTTKADIIGAAIGAGLAGYAIHKSRQESARIEAEEREREEEERRRAKRAIRKEKARSRRAKRFSFYKRHWKGILITLLIIILAAAGGGFFLYYSSLIPMNVSPADAQKMTYEELEKVLWDNGYVRAYGDEENDLDYDDLDQEGNVIEMTVDGNKDFKKGKRYPEDVAIDIRYHSAKEVNPPATAKELKGESYKKAAEAFKKQGFGNVKTKGEKDLFITKWMDNEGEVKKVTVGGNDDYSKTASYRVDEEVVITYHEK